MAQEYGFKFKITGEVFVVQESKSGADVVAAFERAVTARNLIMEVLSEVPDQCMGAISVGEPMAASRRQVLETTATAGSSETDPDPAADDEPPVPDPARDDEPPVLPAAEQVAAQNRAQGKVGPVERKSRSAKRLHLTPGAADSSE